jgi:hypothetical protein
MKTFYGPKSPAFHGGPNRVFGYDEILAPTVVHGPDRPVAHVGDNLPIIDHFNSPHDERAIAPPLIIPDDITTSHGKLIHYNQVRMIAASIIFHHAHDGSLSKVARDKIYYDFHSVLSWTDEMVLLVASPHDYTPDPIAYPPILEAEWINTYADEPYLICQDYSGSIIGRRISKESDYQPIYGPQTFLDYLEDNPDERYEVLSRLENHLDTYQNQGNDNLITWAEKALECWFFHFSILAKHASSRFVPEVDETAPKFDYGIEYRIKPYDG